MDGTGVLPGVEELTQALIATATAATQAVQAASTTTAGGGTGTGDSGGLVKKDLARLIPRPGNFHPADREQEILCWRDWFWSLKQYLVVVDSAYQEELAKIEDKSEEEVDWEFLNEKEQERARFLYSLLGGLVQGRLVGLIKNISNYNGFEALRQMLLNCQPQARNRTMNLLQGIMAYPSFNMKLSILPQLLKLEEHFTQYERLGGKLPDMRAAVLLKAISGPLKIHLNMTLNEGSSYAKIREAVLAYDTANTKWNESAALSFSSSSPMPPSPYDPNGAAPMEIDRLQKGKEKGKGKTKDGKGGKSKGKEEKGKSKGKGGKMVSGAKGDGKGKGGKDKGKGKGSVETCWTCGRPGHLAKDCWRVRQVEAPASNAPSSSTPPTVSPSTTMSVQPGSEVTQKAIRRVSQPVVFDLRHYEETSGEIRVLQSMDMRKKKAAVEFYSIATDDEEDDGGTLSVKVVHEVPPDEWMEEVDEEEKKVKASIIVDSGADASIFPGYMLKQGKKAHGMSPHLQDAQGRAIRTYGHRDVDIELQRMIGW